MKDRTAWALFFSLIAISGILFSIMVILDFIHAGSDGVYSISVIMRSPGDRFTKGMEQAALDYNVDVHAVSGFDPGNGPQQIEYLQRELDNYTDAVIIDPEDPESLAAYLDNGRPRAPVVTVIQPLPGNEAVCHVGADDAELGRILGEWIAGGPGGQCMIIAPKTGFKPLHRTRTDAVKQALDSAGVLYEVRYANADSADIAAEISGEQYTSVAVIDENMLGFVCEAVKPSAGIYGIGYTGMVRAYLESGRIKGLAVYSDYDAGYLSVRAAVEAAGKKAAGGAVLTAYKVTAENMYQDPIVFVLFPIG